MGHFLLIAHLDFRESGPFGHVRFQVYLVVDRLIVEVLHCDFFTLAFEFFVYPKQNVKDFYRQLKKIQVFYSGDHVDGHVALKLNHEFKKESF